MHRIFFTVFESEILKGNGASNVLAVICLAVACPALVKAFNSLAPVRNILPLPPGPKGFPFVGNIFDIPETNLHAWAAEQAKNYGETSGLLT